MTQPGHAHYHRTSIVAVPLLLALVMFSLLRLTGNSWFLLLLGAALGIFGVAATSRAHIDELTLVSWCEPRVAAGQELTYGFRVTNDGRRTSTPASLLLHTDGLADVAVYVGPLRSGEAATFTSERVALRRGVSERSRVEYYSNPFLGLVRAHLIRNGVQLLTIHPQLIEVGRRRLTGGRAEESDGGLAIRGPGTELLGIREWQRGEDHRHVHWRSTARHGRLVVLERGETLLPALRLLLVGPATADGFETALSGAAGLCDSELHSGRPTTVAAWLPGGLTLAPTGSRLELLDWWSSLVDVAVPSAVDLLSAAVPVFGAGELVVAGPAATLDGWLPGVQQISGRLIVRRLEAGP